MHPVFNRTRKAEFNTHKANAFARTDSHLAGLLRGYTLFVCRLSQLKFDDHEAYTLEADHLETVCSTLDAQINNYLTD